MRRIAKKLFKLVAFKKAFCYPNQILQGQTLLQTGQISAKQVSEVGWKTNKFCRDIEK